MNLETANNTRGKNDGRRAEKPLRLRIILVIHSILIFWMITAFAACLSMEAIFALRFACSVFTGMSIWLIASWLWSGGRILSPYFLFLISALVFNGGQIWLYTLDPTTPLLGNEFRPEVLLRAVLLVTTSVMFLHLGAVLVKRTKVVESLGWLNEIDRKSTSQTGWFLFSIAAIPAALSLSSAVRAVTLHGYMFLYQQDQGAGLEAAPQLLAVMLLPATFLILAGNLHKRSIKIFCVCTLLISAGTQLFVGTRGAAMTSLVSFVWLWEQCVGRVRRSFMIMTAATTILLLPIIAMTRNVSGSERSSPAFLIEMLSRIDNPATALIREMGGSMGTIAHTLELVPSLRPYDLGTSYFYAGLAVLPNIFGGPVHPTAAHGLLSKWLVGTVNPAGAAMGFGLGYSFIAESYLNYGWVGTPLLMLALGVAIQALTNWAEKIPSASRFAVVASVISFLLVFPRAESADLMRPLVWYGFLPYVLTQCVANWSRISERLESLEYGLISVDS